MLNQRFQPLSRGLTTALIAALWLPVTFAQDTTGVGAVSGTVRDAQGQAAAGIQTCVADSSRCATTGSDGRFRITELRTGDYALTIAVPGQTAKLSAKVEVRAGVEALVEVTLPALGSAQDTVTVSAQAFIEPEEIKTSGFLIQREEVFKNAGSLQDISRYVQTLPGVAIGSDDFRNDIIVRGGSPLENLFIIDNVEIPNINAFANFSSAGGTVGLLDAALLQDVTFLTGGYPSPYINRASSVLQITQREGSREKFQGRATLGFAGAGTILEGPIKKGKGSWVVSARRSFLDLFTKDTGIGGVPVAYTFNAKALYDLSSRDRVWVNSISGVDKIRLGAVQDKTLDSAELNNLDIRYQGWRNATGINWQRVFGARSVGLLGLTHSEAHVSNTVKDLVRNAIPAASAAIDPLIANSPVVYSDDSREGESTIKYDLTTYVPMLDKLQVGGSFKLFQLNYDTAAPFGTNSPYSVKADQFPFFLKRDFTANQTGLYVQNTRNLGSRLNVSWGARLDRYQYLGARRVSPRASLSYRITDKLSWRASFGSYYQQPFFQFLAAFPQNKGLIPFRADHYVSGFTYVANSTLRFTIEAYRKNYKDYPVAAQLPQLSLANLGDTFDVRQILFPLASAGRGRAQGVELFVEKKFSNKWYGQANLSFSSARQAGLDGAQRAASFNYPRIFNLTGGYRINAKWELATRVSYLAGRPYTPFDTPLSTAQRRAVFDLAQVNALRLPDYFRVDFRVDRTFTVHDKPLLVFVGAQNIFNRENVAGYTWDRRVGGVETNKQLGLFPLVGLDWRF
jgi:outer membrane receptor for ferrienterochelin and colicin